MARRALATDRMVSKPRWAAAARMASSEYSLTRIGATTEATLPGFSLSGRVAQLMFWMMSMTELRGSA